MTVEITVRDGPVDRRYVGHPISNGPRTIVLFLTAPYSQAGQQVTIPVSDVIGRKVVADRH